MYISISSMWANDYFDWVNICGINEHTLKNNVVLNLYCLIFYNGTDHHLSYIFFVYFCLFAFFPVEWQPPGNIKFGVSFYLHTTKIQLIQPS